MTTVFPDTVKCATCGAENEFPVIASTNCFGSSDLDLRPAEMQRSTMCYWVQECPDCGYVSGEVSDPAEITKEFLESDEYVSCDGRKFKSDLAARFYKEYKICTAPASAVKKPSVLDKLFKKKSTDEKLITAFNAILHAAWACDDEQDVENAKYCRNIAISLISKLISGGHDNKDTFSVIKCDLLRRAGRFEDIKNEYSSVKFDNDLLNKIIAFQIDKAEKQDTGCYTVEDAAGE